MYRVGVYTIAYNEEKFASRWAETVKDADYALVADTGSSDYTVDILTGHHINVQSIAINPWRFDDARNASLALLPHDLDVVICLDMDELLVPDWRYLLEQFWTPTTTRLRYQYVWSWTADHRPDVLFYSDKITGRFSHRWKSPVHEILVPTVPEINSVCNSVLIEHHPDAAKSRSQYLPLLELSAKEEPDNDRNSHYLGRELFFVGRWEEAIQELQRHLALPSATWKAERAASMRYIGKCYECLGDQASAHEWFIRATLEDQESRESLVEAARLALSRRQYHATIGYCQQALELPSNMNYMGTRYAREEGPFDLMGCAYWHIGHQQEAIAMTEKALAFNPSDPRLQENMRMVQQQ